MTDTLAIPVWAALLVLLGASIHLGLALVELYQLWRDRRA